MAILTYALHRLGLRNLAVIAAATLAAFLVIPVRHDPAAGAVVDHVRDPHRRAAPPAPRSTPLDSGLLIPFFVLWANLHGLWVVGLVVLGVYAVMTLIGMTPMSPAKLVGGRRRSRWPCSARSSRPPARR